ncbi:hypothetical protein RJ641_032374 [Dillenia turbinata]|uniref:RING-type domain-containing protein n=1 Tax=Dillenia turbinata TaxID=194707 RepID=A0AAN8ZI76_9MAGN
MGSACCVAARDKSLPGRSRGETFHRNVLYSPSLSFRWENRRRVAGETENSTSHFSQHTSRSVSMEMKTRLSLERGNFSDGESPLRDIVTPSSHKSPDNEVLAEHSSGQSMANNNNLEVKDLTLAPGTADLSVPRHLVPISSNTPLSTHTSDTFSPQNNSVPTSSTPSRWAHHSPGRQLLRQVSDSRILGLKSPNNNSNSEGRPSFVLPTCSNDLTAISHGSSDGWSMRTFSELVASSQRQRWSFDSEHFGSGRRKISGSSSRFSYSPPVDLQSCGVCSRLITERSSWCRSNEISVVAVLACGHAYHAECLESMTSEADKYDPVCPICTVGEKQVSKISKKALKAESEYKARNNKISRNRIVDSYLDGDQDSYGRWKCTGKEGKVPKLESSSSARSSFTKPFLKRHFSLGSKWTRSLSETDSARKKGFWARYR